MSKSFFHAAVMTALSFVFICCTCVTGDTSKKEFDAEIDRSDVAVLCNVSGIDNFMFRFDLEVLEVFKGKLAPGDRIKGTFHLMCSPSISREGEWLIMGKWKGEQLKVNTCGKSFYLNYPDPFHIHNPNALLNQEQVRREKVKKGQDILCYLRSR